MMDILSSTLYRIHFLARMGCFNVHYVRMSTRFVRNGRQFR